MKLFDTQKQPPNSLRLKILPVSRCSPEIISDFHATAMIPMDQGEGDTTPVIKVVNSRFPKRED